MDLDIVTDLTTGRGGPFHIATLINCQHRDRRDHNEVGVDILRGDPAGDLVAAYRELKDQSAPRFGQDDRRRQEKQAQRWRDGDARRAADREEGAELRRQAEEEARLREAKKGNPDHRSQELEEEIVVNFGSPMPETSGTSEGKNEEPQQETESQQEEEQAPKRRSQRKPKKPGSTQQTANGVPSKALEMPPGRQKHSC